MFEIQEAQREQVRLKIGISGPAGSGKTFSSLQLAYGLCGDWSKILLADTENRSALYCAGSITGPWKHIDFSSKLPGAYHPNNWLKLFDKAEASGAEVLILDSISHAWNGKGGCLELVEQIGKGFSGWAKVTPLHNKFVDRIRESNLHVIATMRSIQDYVIEKNAKGQDVPRKIGMKSVQREGMDYEFGLIFDINMDHYATASKDRTGLFKDMSFLMNPDIGSQLLDWAKEGKEVRLKGMFDKADEKHKQKLVAILKSKSVAEEHHQAVLDHLDGKMWNSTNVGDAITSIVKPIS